MILEAVDWIDLSQDGGRWWAVLDRVLKFRMSQIAGNFLTG
jgi:hypothetical protein